MINEDITDSAAAIKTAEEKSAIPSAKTDKKPSDTKPANKDSAPLSKTGRNQHMLKNVVFNCRLSLKLLFFVPLVLCKV